MCATCGCSDDRTGRVTTIAEPHGADGVPAHEHGPGHGPGHGHDHTPGPDHVHPVPVPPAPVSRLQRLEIDILAKNDRLADANRERLRERGVVALNLMSSPGSGKTTLLVRTLHELAGELPVAVVEGDQETQLDAERIHATGAPVVQVNTGAGCHLDAQMISEAIDRLDPASGSLLFVENVGNLVCPAAFDLGESAKVVVIAVTEGDDKPSKYPQMFACADLLIVNKIDLLPYVDFDVDACVARAREVNPGLEVLTLSATTGAGLEEWCAWLRRSAVSS
ncbi:hydrogenase nickel incorporation protein HypB [soil metagenome]